MSEHHNAAYEPLPHWLKAKLPKKPYTADMKAMLRSFGLHTVCESARCPNIGECFSRRTATFMILGDICTRSCKFCAVKSGVPTPVDDDEPRRIALMVKALGIRHAVITSVTRDDLVDQGARHFAATVTAIKQLCEGVTVEVLVPDMRGRKELVKIVVESGPDVFNHNIETVRRLQRLIRPQADYQRSLNVLKMAKELDDRIITKSGIMVGLGENDDEVIETMKDLLLFGCDIVTIGQYLQPTRHHYPVMRYVPPEIFERYSEIGMAMGFKAVIAGPFVRSSYMAEFALKLAATSR
ncbi:MAG: lipoyl synthase [Armatimonadota bacterium]|nr:lipoyl synthase [Armatimonadota bacterium]MCX7777789.1 lipoyl synthase [Armatimonadota bacterium]MDW8025324.1 lipoyl synthase [Armatimonadota bacterium]